MWDWQEMGTKLAWQVAEKDFDYYVIELSSFQLDGMIDFKAEIAVLLEYHPRSFGSV